MLSEAAVSDPGPQGHGATGAQAGFSSHHRTGCWERWERAAMPSRVQWDS